MVNLQIQYISDFNATIFKYLKIAKTMECRKKVYFFHKKDSRCENNVVYLKSMDAERISSNAIRSAMIIKTNEDSFAYIP